jgi:hypothetical protein
LGAITFNSSQGHSADSQPLPAAVCKAIEAYVAQIGAARSVSDKSKREAQYTEAKTTLASVLKQQGKDHLLDKASGYAELTEAVVIADSKSTDLADVLERRLKTRAALLEMCSDYTMIR